MWSRHQAQSLAQLLVSVTDRREGTRREESLRPRSCFAARRLAPGPWPASLVATSQSRLGVRARSGTCRSGAGGSARLERRDSAATKTVPERSRSASAPFRPKRSRGRVAEPMLYWRSSHPSRRRTVRFAAEGLFFHGAKWSAEPPASLRQVSERAAVCPAHVAGARLPFTVTPHEAAPAASSSAQPRTQASELLPEARPRLRAGDERLVDGAGRAVEGRVA